MREVVGKSKIDEALTSGKAQIQQDTQTLLQTILDSYQSRRTNRRRATARCRSAGSRRGRI